MTRFILSPEAKKDLETVWSEGAAEDIDAADRLLEELYQAILWVARAPDLGFLRPDLSMEALRVLRIRDYLIIYRPERRPLQVVRVLRGYRELARPFQPGEEASDRPNPTLTTLPMDEPVGGFDPRVTLAPPPARPAGAQATAPRAVGASDVRAPSDGPSPADARITGTSPMVPPRASGAPRDAGPRAPGATPAVPISSGGSRDAAASGEGEGESGMLELDDIPAERAIRLEASRDLKPPPRPRSRLRLLGRVLLVLFGLGLIGLGIAAVPAYRTAKVWWDEAIQVADKHLSFEISHPGWSFPARIQTTATPLDIHPARLVVEAKARDYVEDCKDTGPGEYCAKTEKVVPRSGTELEPVELGWLIGPDGEIRFHLPFDETPKLLLHAILAGEDREYYEHNGVNFTAMIRAAIANAQEGTYVQGGSTLTMQVVRNLVQRKEKTVERKLREMVMAMALDRHLEKKGVLQIYLDFPYLGQRGGFSICGFKAAAWHYYGKDVKDLTLGEAATLAGILPAPGKFAPDIHPDKAKERRNLVLHSMKELYGYDIEAALEEPIATQPPPPMPDRFPAYLSATRAWLEDHLPDNLLYGAGLNITVGMDVFLQDETSRMLLSKPKYFESLVGHRGKDGEPLQAAGVVLEPQTGLIKAMYGGSGMTKISFNRATQARRQAGSAFKPLVYALAFSEPPRPDGKPAFTPAHQVPNSPRVFKTPQGDWSPRNIGGEYTGTACLAQGLAWSQNIATASLLEEVGGPEKLIPFAAKLGFDTSKYPHEMGLALGQGEVTVLEMAQFAGLIANGGRKLQGTPVLRAVDASGKERIGPPKAGEQVLSPEATALTRELMRLVIDVGTGGKARGGGGEGGYSGPVLGKTGTADKEKDVWFVGATPRYAAALWMGYDTPTKIGGSASDLASPLWGWWIHHLTRYDGEPPKFESDVKLIRRDICTVTGKNPNESCRRIAAPFLPGTAPREVCNLEHPPPIEEVDEEEMLEGEGGLSTDGVGEPGAPVEGVSPDGSPEGRAPGAGPGDPATADATAPEKKKKKGYENLWDRLAREKAEREAAEKGAAGEKEAGSEGKGSSGKGEAKAGASKPSGAKSDPKSGEAKSTKGEGSKPDSKTDTKTVEKKSTDSKTAEKKSTDSKTAEKKSTDSKSREAKSDPKADAKSGEAKSADAKTREAKSSGSKSGSATPAGPAR